MNFTEKVIQLQDEAKNYILSKVQDGGKLELVTEEQIAESSNEIFYELPQVTLENKYNEVTCYCIVSIERQGTSIDLYGYGLGDNWGESYIFTPYELNVNELCYIADYLK